jgi:hypothetical protein
VFNNTHYDTPWGAIDTPSQHWHKGEESLLAEETNRPRIHRQNGILERKALKMAEKALTGKDSNISAMQTHSPHTWLQ